MGVAKKPPAPPSPAQEANTMVTEQQIKLARDKFKEISGITIYTPDEGTLDDFEQSRYDGLVAALEAALSTDAEPVKTAPAVAVKDACAPDLLLYNLLMEAINEGVAKATDPDWTTKDFGKSPYYQAIHAALSAQVQDDLAGHEPYGTPRAGAMRVIDADQWEPCSPSYLSRGGCCATAPRVWNAEGLNHWHPKIPASPASKHGGP